MTSSLANLFIVLALLGVFAALFAIFLSLRAIFSGELLPVDADEGAARAALLDRKRALLESLRDLGEDHATGKIDEEDFGLLSGQLRAELAEVLAAIDARVEAKRDEIEALIRGEKNA